MEINATAISSSLTAIRMKLYTNDKSKSNHTKQATTI